MTWLDAFLARPMVPLESGLEAPLAPAQEGEGAVPHRARGHVTCTPGVPWDPTLEALCQAHPEEASYLRAERAAVLSYCAGLPHEHAEHLAGLR